MKNFKLKLLSICIVVAWLGALAVTVDGAVGSSYMPEPAVYEELQKSPDGTAYVIVMLEKPLVAADATLKEQQQVVKYVQDSVLQKLAPGEFTVVYKYENFAAMTGRINEAGLSKLVTDPQVIAVGPDASGHGHLDDSVPFINADDVHALGYTGQGITVAVLDTGIDGKHPDVNDNLASGAYHFLNQGANTGPGANDNNGHGTNVSGIITSKGQVASVGVAPDADILAIKVLDVNGSGWVSDWAAGVDYVVSHKNDYANLCIINMSLGTYMLYSQCPCDNCGAYTYLLQASLQAAKNTGIVTFASSGNQGSCNSMSSPACLSAATAVAAVYDQDLGREPDKGTYYNLYGGSWPKCYDNPTYGDLITCFSNRSACNELAAPGRSITAPGMTPLPPPYNTSTYTGTSQAAPHCSGVAALMAEKAQALGLSLTPNAIVHIMKDTGAPTVDPCSTTPNPIRADALAAVSGIEQYLQQFKWVQPPVPAEVNNLYYGWNEISEYGGPQIVADDWQCENEDPITDIHWWGSFKGWKEPEPPQMPKGFHIAIWTNVPPNPSDPQSFSHPGYVIWEIDCNNFTYEFVGWDYDPQGECFTEACFKFTQFLEPWQYFYQEPGAAEPTIYWISIAAKYDPDVVTDYPWGWKTRPRTYEDDAVRIFYPTEPHMGYEYEDGEPIYWPDPNKSWDMAFELTAQSIAQVVKYGQKPDLDEGIDVDATVSMVTPALWGPQLLADDFPCEQTGEITDIHIWGSWYYDDLPGDDPNNVIFTLSFHKNNPSGPGGWSVPVDPPLWTCEFGPGQFTVEKVPTTRLEAYYCPCTAAGWFPNNHLGVYKYSFYLPDADCAPFYQEQGNIYWLDVQAMPQTTNPNSRFGWKTSTVHWQDDADWAPGREGSHGAWRPLTHPDTGETLDLAFEITTVTYGRIYVKWSQPPQPFAAQTYNGWNEVSVYNSTQQIVADDWFCQTDWPVTDIHWWGSFRGWQCEYPPLMPQSFHIAIWTDVPPDLQEPVSFSHPGQVIWETDCSNYTCKFVGWDIDPRDPCASPEACFKFEQDIPQNQWFYQDPCDKIYWVSIAAKYGDLIPEHLWGWKTRPRDPESLAPDDAVRIFNPTAPILGSQYVNGQAIEWPTGQSWDLAFVLTTKKPPKPPFEHIKWSQPPIEISPGLERPVYSGWDEISIRELWEPPENWMIVADDFRCLGNMPITSIHWFGSYFGWEQVGSMPPQLPIGWKICFWSNVPANPFIDPGFSYPKTLLWQIEVPADRVDMTEVGTDYYHGYYPEDICYQYTLKLEPNEWFWQGKFEPNTIDNIFWLSIAALYPLGPPPEYPWGWKTRPWSWMDDAIRFQVMGPLEPDMVLDPYLNYMDPIEDPCYLESFDVAFELDTDPCYIKWEQPYTGIRDWPYYEDELSMASTETIVEEVTKWIQKPDTSPNGIDVDASDDMWRKQLLADDFPCEMTGPITDFHIWGSWYHDHPPNGDANAVTFILSIHKNLPAGDPCNPYWWSIPGDVLWMRTFVPGEFQVEEYTRLEEGWFVPCAEPQYYDPHADNICWMYSFFVNPTEAFWQEQGEIYWLDVQAIPAQDTTGWPEVIRFGWKDSRYHFMDNAVWAVADEPVPVPGPWQPLWYPVGHPYEQGPIDLAFAITTDFGYKYVQEPDLESFASIDIDATKDQIWNPQVLADDFKCTTTEPVTDIHLWGSWWRDFMPDSNPGNVQFTLSIHSDIPAEPPEIPYSRPGPILWQQVFDPGEFNASIYAEDLQEGYFVPCADPQYYEPFSDSICVQYNFYIDPCDAFMQQGSTTMPVVYWLSVQARPVVPIGVPVEPFRSRFGWKTTDPKYHWNDDAVWSEDGGTTWNELRYPLWHPYEGQTADLAFSITNQRMHEELVIQRRVTDDWLCERETPMTAAVWWGSYLGYRYKPCHGPQMAPPVKPDYFELMMWNDVPADQNVPASFSHPNEVVWRYMAYDYDEVLVGYDKMPHSAPQEPVFRYSVQIPDPNHWFWQKDVNGIYWFSVMAVYDVNRPNYPWGWTNHKHMFNDNAAAWEQDDTGLWKWVPLYDQSVPPASADMSFMLFAEDCVVVGQWVGGWLITQQMYNKWVAKGRPACWCYPCHYKGDVNNDGLINTTDLRSADGAGPPDLNGWKDAWDYRAISYQPCCDTNNDGLINTTDLRGTDGPGGLMRDGWIDGWTYKCP